MDTRLFRPFSSTLIMYLSSLRAQIQIWICIRITKRMRIRNNAFKVEYLGEIEAILEMAQGQKSLSVVNVGGLSP
jgi:hypothetical protein